MRFLNAAVKGITITLSLVLSACMMGPNFRTPAPPPTSHYTEAPDPKKTTHIPAAGKGGVTQEFVAKADIPGQWWYLFHSQAINDLVERGLANSPTLASAKATLVEAEENLNAEFGGLMLPAITAQIGGERERINLSNFGQSAATTSSIFNLYNSSVNVTYTLDLFGANRRTVEEYAAQVDYQHYELIGSYLTLTSNIVTSAVSAASYKAQIEATQDIIHSLRRQLLIMRKQQRLGGVSGNDVFSQQTQLSQTEGTLPPLQQSYNQTVHTLAVLVGTVPADFAMPEIKLDQLNLPRKLPVTIPSRLVRQRPDIQWQEALLHAACAQVGVTTANLFPQISISGAFGYESLIPKNLFKKASNIWSYGGNILQPVFNGGQLRALRRAAIAAYEAQEGQYQQTVLLAFQNVADSLRALEFDARTLKALKEAEIASRRSLNITTEQYRLGGVTYIILLTAEKQYQQSVISRVRAQATRYSDTAALFQALGGGWWNAPEKYLT
jgi:NodT family efflux transporter outer membrane factor (OMF) lipoprotein